MNLIRTCKGQLLGTLLLFIAILIMPFQDYTERRLTAADMNYPEASAGIAGETGEDLYIPEGAGKLTLESDPYYLKKGSYQVTFSIVTAAEDNSVEVVDALSLQEDNTAGHVLAESLVSPEENLITLSFTIEDYVSCVRFLVQSSSALEFQGIYLLSETGLYQDPLIYACLLLLCSGLLLLYRSRRKIRPEILLLLAFAAVWSSVPLCFPWLPKGHDMYFHYGRLFALSEDLYSGSLPVRIHTSMFQGFGYMSPVFYPETLLYPFAFLIRLGLSPIGCYRLLLLSVNLATAGVSYYAFSRLCRSRNIGLVTAVFYTLSTYRLINLYTRAAIGEVLASVFLPLLLLGMYQLFYGDSKRWFAACLAFTGLFHSHMISTILALGFSVLFGLFSIRRLKEGRRLLHLIVAGSVTVLLNLWYMIPLLYMLRLPVAFLGDSRNLAGYSLYAIQLFDTALNNPAGVAEGRGSIAGEMPYSIGLLLLAGSLLFVMLCFRKKTKLPVRQKRLGFWCLTLGALSVYASTIYFPWEALQKIGIINQVAGTIQFASRFLPFATLFLCIVSAIALHGFSRERPIRQLLFFGCLFFLTWSAGSYFSNFSNEAEVYVSWNEQMDHAEDSDALYLINDSGDYVSERRIRAQSIIFTASDGVALSSVSRDGTKAAFSWEKSDAEGESWVDVPLNYYPFYHAFDENGKELATKTGEMLRLRVLLPEEADSGTVTVSFEIPALWHVGDAVSLLTLCALIALVILSLRQKRLTAKTD